MPALLLLGALGVSLLQAAAIGSALGEWTALPGPVAWPLALVLGLVPVLGAALALAGAATAWGWGWPLAALVFGAPLVLAAGLAVAGGARAVLGRGRPGGG